jgi:phosphopantetheinyl transferase (holo-ACP synthase)
MDKPLKNLFPAIITKGAMKTFGNQAIQPFLLGILAAPAPVAGSLQADANIPFRHMLHPREAALLGDYRFTKRRSEYLTGRICAKMAITDFLQLHKMPAIPLNHSDIEIANTESGRPDIRIHAASAAVLEMDISISHSGNYGVALVTGSRCGIDLQMRQASLLRVREKYCRTEENKVLASFLPEYNPVTRLALLWSAKEAAKKALSCWQMPGFLELQVTQLKSLSNSVVFYLRIRAGVNRQLPQEVSVVAGLFGDYALAICLVDED